MNIPLTNNWKRLLASELEQNYFKKMWANVESEYKTQTVYPPKELIFNAFTQTPFEAVTVVILGQDPYHGPGQAMGLSFSVPDDVKIPPSLKNIYKEISTDLGVQPPSSGNLERWAQQGVLLLNTVLTVRGDVAASHQNYGWEQFTNATISALSLQREHIVFLLWGSHAIKKASLIDERKHLVLTAPHPSPLSAHRGFFGCRHFSKTNKYLQEYRHKPIIW